MTAKVISIRIPPKGVGAGGNSEKQEATAYYCLRCGGESFQLHASGAVYCYGCGSLMRNLKVEQS